MTRARILADYVAGGTTAAEFDYMDGVTSNVQTQLDAKLPLAGGTMTGGLTVGVDDTGQDVKFFGASSGACMLYDESEDTLEVRGPSADATTSTGKLALTTALTNINDGDILGRIDFKAPLEASGTDAVLPAASIWAEAEETFSASDNGTALVFGTHESASAIRRMTINKSGNVGIGNANPSYPLDMSIDSNILARFNRDGSSGEVILITDDGSTVAELRTDSDYVYVSDYRLKENIADLGVDAIARVNALKPRTFNFKKTPDKPREGFIAHEVQSVIPVAVDYEKDGTDEDGKDKYQMMNDGSLIPTLVKAIQELSAKNDALEAKVTALENA